MKPKLLIIRDIKKDIINKLAEHFEIDYQPSCSRKQLLMSLQEAYALLNYGIKIDEELIQHAPNLKLVSNISVGYDNFDTDVMKKAGIIGTHTPYILNDSVVDLTFGLMLSAARRISELDAKIKKGLWTVKDDVNYYGLNVHHKKLGIIGMGRIGEDLARRAKLGFLMDVSYYNRRKKPELEEQHIYWKPLEKLLAESDFIVMLTPLTAETKNMIDASKFKQMKNTAVFINMSRGATVDEKAMYFALKNKEIYAAASDVFVQEPINMDNPLLQLENFTAAPHIGSAIHETRDDMAQLAAENIIEVLIHGKKQNVVPELQILLK
ncbi:D-glycerate dehydrogenase [Rummeliibacillus sp. SL167]|uniref:2-hydroxyacid dehydrogenase n=1 Tax=Rummeliibacillus sp. SL167 TaxID=2579792 RepID=UPI0011B38484|nr:D-glycerate dehydrogenase [Rummeliibacillus sp. SL167]